MHRTAAEYMHNMALIISNYILFVLLLKEGQMSCVIARNYGKLTSKLNTAGTPVQCHVTEF